MTPLITKKIFLKKYLYRKKVFKSWYIFGSGSVFPRKGSEDPDPDQNETNLKHWIEQCHLVRLFEVCVVCSVLKAKCKDKGGNSFMASGSKHLSDCRNQSKHLKALKEFREAMQYIINHLQRDVLIKGYVWVVYWRRRVKATLSPLDPITLRQFAKREWISKISKNLGRPSEQKK